MTLKLTRNIDTGKLIRCTASGKLLRGGCCGWPAGTDCSHCYPEVPKRFLSMSVSWGELAGCFEVGGGTYPYTWGINVPAGGMSAKMQYRGGCGYGAYFNRAFGTKKQHWGYPEYLWDLYYYYGSPLACSRWASIAEYTYTVGWLSCGIHSYDAVNDEYTMSISACITPTYDDCMYLAGGSWNKIYFLSDIVKVKREAGRCIPSFSGSLQKTFGIDNLYSQEGITNVRTINVSYNITEETNIGNLESWSKYAAYWSGMYVRHGDHVYLSKRYHVVCPSLPDSEPGVGAYWQSWWDLIY